jgi:hypothetical protein
VYYLFPFFKWCDNTWIAQTIRGSKYIFPVVDVATDLRPYAWTSIGTMLVTGYLLFASEALKCYDSPSFRFKMVCLILALVFQFTVYHKATTSDKADSSPGFARITAILALVLWFGVGLGGRAIGFL